jgi:hypothetical protein
MTDNILDYVRKFANEPCLAKNKISYELLEMEMPVDTYWELVKLAADVQTPVEDYVKNLLITYVEQKNVND